MKKEKNIETQNDKKNNREPVSKAEFWLVIIELLLMIPVIALVVLFLFLC